MTPTRVAALLACMGYAIFVVWYAGAPRLSLEEADAYIELIERQPPDVRGDLDLVAFRRFLESDDGRPFYNVNLFRLRDRALYGDGGVGREKISGREAYARYAAFMLRALPTRACHGVFLSTSSENDAWDVVATVRYRSRRDIAELFVSPEFTRAVVHKWAALEGNERVPVTARGLLATLYLPVAALLVVMVSVVYSIHHGLVLGLRRWRGRAPAGDARGDSGP